MTTTHVNETYTHTNETYTRVKGNNYGYETLL